MHDGLRKYCVGEDAVIFEGIQAIDQSDEGVALVVNQTGQLLGILTDGDIRRALLAGNGMGQPIAPHVKRSFFSVNEHATRTEVLDLMQARKIRHVPVVNESNDLLGIHFLSSIIGAKELPNWAVIMAGGKGTRLGTLTCNIPKPMIKVAGRPILERVVLHLVSHGIRHIFISVNYLGEQIEEHFGNGMQFGCRIEYLRESPDNPLGTAGSLALLPDEPTDPVFVMNGDLVTDIDVASMLDFHANYGFDLVMGVRPYSHEIPFGCVETEGVRVSSLTEKPILSRLVNAGVYVLSPSVVKDICMVFLPITSVFEEALLRGRSVGAYHLSGDWLDVGRPSDLKKAQGDMG